MGKTATEILIERFLKEVDEREQMPWQRPYEMFNAFNYFSLEPYRGFNRIMLPFGEYMTKNQINKYNKEHNEDYRFQKGIRWFPVVFFKNEIKEVSKSTMEELFPDLDLTKDGYIGRDSIWSYFIKEGKYYKQRNILRYHEVADRHYFKNSKGEILPSRIETGEVVITKSEPKKVIDRYVNAEGVKMIYDHRGVPCYVPREDKVMLNPVISSEDEWFSTAFHELGHSTGAKHRLNRVGITREGVKNGDRRSVYAVEECIAEITAYLCCAECGIHDFKTSETMSYKNNLAYVQSWKKAVKDFGKEFFYICSQADKAFNRIMGME